MTKFKSQFKGAPHHKEKMLKVDAYFKSHNIPENEVHIFVGPDILGSGKIVYIDTSTGMWSYDGVLNYFATEPDKDDIHKIFKYVDEHMGDAIYPIMMDRSIRDRDALLDAIEEMMIKLAEDAGKFHKIPQPTTVLAFKWLCEKKSFRLHMTLQLPGFISETMAVEHFRMHFFREPAAVVYNVMDTWILGPISLQEHIQARDYAINSIQEDFY